METYVTWICLQMHAYLPVWVGTRIFFWAILVYNNSYFLVYVEEFKEVLLPILHLFYTGA